MQYLCVMPHNGNWTPFESQKAKSAFRRNGIGNFSASLLLTNMPWIQDSVIAFGIMQMCLYFIEIFCGVWYSVRKMQLDQKEKSLQSAVSIARNSIDTIWYISTWSYDSLIPPKKRIVYNLVDVWCIFNRCWWSTYVCVCMCASNVNTNNMNKVWICRIKNKAQEKIN